MPVTGEVDNEKGLIAFLFNGIIVIEDIIATHKMVSTAILNDEPFLEINVFDRDSRFHELDRKRLEQLKQEIMNSFERKDIHREKIAAIELSKEVGLINPLWKAMVTTDKEIKSSYAWFDTIDEGCVWLGIESILAMNLLKKIGFRAD